MIFPTQGTDAPKFEIGVLRKVVTTLGILATTIEFTFHSFECSVINRHWKKKDTIHLYSEEEITDLIACCIIFK